VAARIWNGFSACHILSGWGHPLLAQHAVEGQSAVTHLRVAAERLAVAADNRKPIEVNANEALDTI